MSKLMVCVLVIKQDSFPSLAIFEFNDFFGVTHSFCEKIPVLGIEIKEVPYFAWIECIVIEKKNASLLISTHKPNGVCLLYTSPSPRDRTRSRMPSSA